MTTTVVLKMYDVAATGTELSAKQAKAVMYGHGGSGSDVLLDPKTLQAFSSYPLYTAGSPSRWRFDITKPPISLAVAWPTSSNGYSYIILDNAGAGFSQSKTIVFNYQAALDAKVHLDASLRRRTDYVHSTAFDSAYSSAVSNLGLANGATTDSDRGKYGQLALEAIDRASYQLLIEYGPVFAKAHTTPAQIGLTVDDITKVSSWASLASTVAGAKGWVRLVFDPSEGPSYYASSVAAAHAAGLKVLGEPIDSAEAWKYSRSSYLSRVQSYVNYFPSIEAWEVGNEVNGRWVPSYIPGAISDCAAWVQQNSSAAVVLTLYWQIGTDSSKFSTFNWARSNLPAAVRANIDTILLSTYIGDAPLGALGFEQVMQALIAEFPNQKIGMGELDYANPTISNYWWAFNQSDSAAARRDVAAFYYAASLGYAAAIGGVYWWYFVEEFPTDSGLQSAVENVAAQLV